jgi:hypothetical protein
MYLETVIRRWCVKLDRKLDVAATRMNIGEDDDEGKRFSEKNANGFRTNHV